MEWTKCWPADNTLTGLNKGPTLDQLDHIFWRILTSWTFDQNFQHYNIYPFFFS